MIQIIKKPLKLPITTTNPQIWIRAPIDLKLGSMYGLDTRLLHQQIKDFVLSPAGRSFVKRSAALARNERWLRLRSVDLELFQWGSFQFIFKAVVNKGFFNQAEFCFVLSKGGENDALTIQDFNNLQKAYLRAPDFVVEPLSLFTDSKITVYSTRLYPEHLEVNYNPDGVFGRCGLHINSAKVKNTVRPFNLEEQDSLLEEMIKILTILYIRSGGEFVSNFGVNAGDFILDYRGLDDFSMRLITVRGKEKCDIPHFICRLITYPTPVRQGFGDDWGKGTKKDPLLVAFLFDLKTLRNGLRKAFKYYYCSMGHSENVSALATERDIKQWLGQYNTAWIRGELAGFISWHEQQMVEAHLSELPVHYHIRSDGSD